MIAIFYAPIVLSLLVLGAHFMRYGNEIGMICSIALLGLMFLRQPWVARLVQVALVLGALEWVRTLYELVQVRTALGEPATRMVIILGSVAVVTLVSALLFQSKTMKKVYRLDSQ
ncbi:MAG: hypothetical protein OER91_07310 [Gammaproteobacteria bacterium]|nr:hypothetical protein [Gammaproteobacteria bacterium]